MRSQKSTVVDSAPLKRTGFITHWLWKTHWIWYMAHWLWKTHWLYDELTSFFSFFNTLWIYNALTLKNALALWRIDFKKRTGFMTHWLQKTHWLYDALTFFFNAFVLWRIGIKNKTTTKRIGFMMYWLWKTHWIYGALILKNALHIRRIDLYIYFIAHWLWRSFNSNLLYFVNCRVKMTLLVVGGDALPWKWTRHHLLSRRLFCTSGERAVQWVPCADSLHWQYVLPHHRRHSTRGEYLGDSAAADHRRQWCVLQRTAVLQRRHNPRITSPAPGTKNACLCTCTISAPSISVGISCPSSGSDL